MNAKDLQLTPEEIVASKQPLPLTPLKFAKLYPSTVATTWDKSIANAATLKEVKGCLKIAINNCPYSETVNDLVSLIKELENER